MNGNAPPKIDRMAVKISHLDKLLGLTGEIIITSGNISILQRRLQGLSGVMDKDSLDMVKNAAMAANRISSDLHHLVMDIRQIPIKDTFLRFRRLVRDLARKKGRQVNFEIIGEDTLVDKTVAERLYEPLAHQIRNAIDHGLEDPLERKQKGKEPSGSLILKAIKKEGLTYITVEDDGRGLDKSAVKRKAVENGLISEAAAGDLSDAQCYELIMKPGFSTAGVATEISGRGVGMDVVKATVEELGGEVLIESIPSKGSKFTYKIPQLSAINITDALIVRAGEDYYAIPIQNVVATQSFLPDELHSAMASAESIIYLGSIVPLHDLSNLLAGRRLNENRDNIPVIIIEAKNGRIALKVSEFVRPQKLVLIPLPDLFDVIGVSGTTILGGSQLGLVLDPFELVALATNQAGKEVEERFLTRAAVDIGVEEPLHGVERQPETISSNGAVGFGDVSDPSAYQEVDGKLAEEFFQEIRNIMSELNEDIFLLEKEPENSRRVNTIFRHFHSIKGNLIMTGFNALGAFVHDVESVLDRMRDKELAPTSEIIDLLLDVVRVLEEAVNSIQSGRRYAVTDRDLIKTLEEYKRREVQAEEEEEAEETFRMGPLNRLLLQAKINRKINVYQMFIRFDAGFQESFLVAYLVLKRLTMIGDVIDTMPALERIEKGQVTDNVKVLFAANYSQEEVRRFAENQLKKYYNVKEFELLLME